jgi:hypothetical protein
LRHMRPRTAGQRAIAAAEAWAMAEVEGRTLPSRGKPSKKDLEGGIILAPEDHFSKLFGVGHNSVTQARGFSDAR